MTTSSQSDISQLYPKRDLRAYDHNPFGWSPIFMGPFKKINFTCQIDFDVNRKDVRDNIIKKYWVTKMLNLMKILDNKYIERKYLSFVQFSLRKKSELILFKMNCQIKFNYIIFINYAFTKKIRKTYDSILGNKKKTQYIAK